MAEIVISISQEEKDVVVAAIQRLIAIPHIKRMSQAMIADTAGIKATKIRVILQELVNEGRITQYQATDNPKLQRYFYTINEVQDEQSAEH